MSCFLVKHPPMFLVCCSWPFYDEQLQTPQYTAERAVPWLQTLQSGDPVLGRNLKDQKKRIELHRHPFVKGLIHTTPEKFFLKLSFYGQSYRPHFRLLASASEAINCKIVVFGRFRMARSAVSVILACKAREPHTPVGRLGVWGEKTTVCFSYNEFVLSGGRIMSLRWRLYLPIPPCRFTFAPDLSFEYWPSLAFAKNWMTFSQSNEAREPVDILLMPQFYVTSTWYHDLID